MKLHAIAALSVARLSSELRIAVLQTTRPHFEPEFDLDRYSRLDNALHALKNVQQTPGLHDGKETLLSAYRLLALNSRTQTMPLIYYFGATPSKTAGQTIARNIRRSRGRIRTVGIGLEGKGTEGQRVKRYLQDVAGSKEDYYEIPDIKKFLC
jgi:hypothetical protein